MKSKNLSELRAYYDLPLVSFLKVVKSVSDNKIIVPELNNETIESMIYIVRGEKLMLDFELARIYGYETKTFNQ